MPSKSKCSYNSSLWLCFFFLSQTSTLTTNQGLNLAACPEICRCTNVSDNLEVDCSHHGLTDYPNFDTLPIEYLNLAGNNFYEFPSHLRDIKTLTYLDLSHNRISHLEPNALQGFVSLRTLVLANNSFTSWNSLKPDVTFKQADNLKHLILSGNKLDIFTDAKPAWRLISNSLNQLELTDCNITSISGDRLVEGLPQLDRLVLSDNNLKNMVSLPSRSLRVLEVSNSKLRRLSPFLLEGLPNLEVLNISWNPGVQFDSTPVAIVSSWSLNELDISFCNLDAIDLSRLPNLTKLNLRGNMIRSVTTSTFVNNTLLEILDLARNSLHLIDGASFTTLRRLTKIDLSFNEISYLDRNLFRMNEALVLANLSHNTIKKFTKLVSKSVREVDLSWNEITSIDVKALSGLSTIRSLILSNNLIRDFPVGMQSETLQTLLLSNCRLTTVRNATFRDFPELDSLWLNGNRFTNPLSREYFRWNKHLNRIWLGDNPWICNCHDITFKDFYEFVTETPEKIMDKDNIRCASPLVYYGKTWESACLSSWARKVPSKTAQRFWSSILLSLVVVTGCLFLYSCIKRLMKNREEMRNRNEYQRNQEEMQVIRRQNARILQEEGAPNAPNPYESNLPSYEDALLMPKLERPTKSMVDLRTSSRIRRKPQLAPTNVGEEDKEISSSHHAEDEELILDYYHRFRSEDMLSNRAKDRIAPISAFRRCSARTEYNTSGSHCLGYEDTHFTTSQVKSQNLQSSEKIANFQNNESSPYRRRRPRIREMRRFKKAILKADSVEFLTDPEYETDSITSSPFAQRRPKNPNPPTHKSIDASSHQESSSDVHLDPAIDNYFGQKKYRISNSRESSDFQIVVESKVIASTSDDPKYFGSDESTQENALGLGRRKRRRNSSSRRASGSFSAAAAVAAAESSDSSCSDPESKVMAQHKPMKETLL